MIKLLNMDCMEYLANQPDNSFDLAIVDPPYGIDVGNDSRAGKYFTDNTKKGSKPIMARGYKKSDWDKEPPSKEYFIELSRVSKNQVIWGANHFMDKVNAGSSCWLVWDKMNGDSNLADCELAYTSFKTAVKKFSYLSNGFQQQKVEKSRIHPTQKPVDLYSWILNKYAEKGQKILDTHLGSGSSAIAAHYFGCDFVGCEIDEDYYKAAVNRFNNETKQLDLLA